MGNNRHIGVSVAAITAALLLLIIGMSVTILAINNEVKVRPDTGANKSSHTVSNHDHSNDSAHDHKVAPPATSEKADLLIIFSDSGFDRSTYEVSAGDTVRVENGSRNAFYFATGDHANHTIDSPLNVGTIQPGGASSFIAPEPGVYNFHNHKNETQAGTLRVR